jgi:hypothetical protein
VLSLVSPLGAIFKTFIDPLLALPMRKPMPCNVSVWSNGTGGGAAAGSTVGSAFIGSVTALPGRPAVSQ